MKDCFNDGKNSTTSIMNNSSDIDTSEFNTVEDFQKFIDENGIQNPSEFRNNFSTKYFRLCRLGFSDKVVYPNRRVPMNYSIEELQKIIDSNNIRTAKEFKQKFKPIYGYVNRKGLGKLLKYPDAPKDCNFIKDLETAQNFIDENNIQNHTDFMERFPSECRRLKYLKLSGKVKYPNPLLHIRHNYRNTFLTLEEIQEFIDSHSEITSPYVFERLYPSLYYRSGTIGVRKLLKFPNRTIVWGDKYKTSEEMQEFISENNVINLTDFKIRFPKEYNKTKNEGYITKLYFPEKQKSSLEIVIERVINELGILEYIPNCRSLDWLSYKENLELDFYIQSLNLGIEGQGSQHFIEIPHFGGLEEFNLRKTRDLIKFNLCKEHGVTILYFSNPQELKRQIRGVENKDEEVQKLLSNYFAPVITTEEDLIAEIKKYMK